MKVCVDGLVVLIGYWTMDRASICKTVLHFWRKNPLEKEKVKVKRIKCFKKSKKRTIDRGNISKTVLPQQIFGRDVLVAKIKPSPSENSRLPCYVFCIGLLT